MSEINDDRRTPERRGPRKVVAYSLISLDGVAEEPGNWMFEVDPEVYTFLGSIIGSQDDVLLGRGTYDYWVDYWPASDVEPFASFINTTPKHVFTSTSLDKPWHGSQVADLPLERYVHTLRAGEGRDIGVHGSISLFGSLLAHDLIDELHLVVVPTVAGNGARLFPHGLDRPIRLTCTHQSTAPSGTHFLTYARTATRSTHPGGSGP